LASLSFRILGFLLGLMLVEPAAGLGHTGFCREGAECLLPVRLSSLRERLDREVRAGLLGLDDLQLSAELCRLNVVSSVAKNEVF